MEVMGRVWPENAVWRHVFTAPLSTIVALDESPLDASLLVAGTDDGLVQVTEDGGATWRRIDVPGVPETVYVTDVEASRHNANVIYATASNRKRGDFRPFLLVSNDRGRKWEVRVAGMSQRDPLWSVVEDDEDPDILFVGSEFGVYVSTDRGASWHRFGRLPTIQVRELEVQAREDDLVLATFGRGFQVFDDVSFLREADAVTDATEAHLFAVKDAYSFRTNVGSSGSSGQQHWSVPNPPYGVRLTVWTGEQTAGGDTMFVAIRDAATRREVNRVALTDDAGLQRVHWNLTEAPDSLAGRGGRGGRGGGGGRGGRGGASGPPVTGGTFEAAIVRGSGLSNVLTEWRRFSVRPLPVER
jgi:hypothetical protein